MNSSSLKRDGILQKKYLWFIGVEVKYETKLKNLCMLNAVKMIVRKAVP